MRLKARHSHDFSRGSNRKHLIAAYLVSTVGPRACSQPRTWPCASFSPVRFNCPGGEGARGGQRIAFVPAVSKHCQTCCVFDRFSCSASPLSMHNQLRATWGFLLPGGKGEIECAGQGEHHDHPQVAPVVPVEAPVLL